MPEHSRSLPHYARAVNDRMVNIWRFAILALVAGIVASGVVACFSLTTRRYALLDSRLGASAWQPTNLLATLSWEYRPDGQNPLGLGFPDFFDLQHQALLRLLDIQRSQFGHRTPRRTTGGDYIDHSFVHVAERTNSRVVVIATGSLKPVHFEGSSIHGRDSYWQMERFTFTSSGELLSRESHKE